MIVTSLARFQAEPFRTSPAFSLPIVRARTRHARQVKTMARRDLRKNHMQQKNDSLKPPTFRARLVWRRGTNGKPLSSMYFVPWMIVLFPRLTKQHSTIFFSRRSFNVDYDALPCLYPSLLQRCELLVWGLKCLIHEMQGSQVYVDKDGAVKRRVRPKHMLTTVHQQHTHHHHHRHHSSSSNKEA